MILVMPHTLVPGANEMKETADIHEIIKAIEDFIDAKLKTGDNQDAVNFCRKRLSDTLYGEMFSI
jgi:hypothetical protein